MLPRLLALTSFMRGQRAEAPCGASSNQVQESDNDMVFFRRDVGLQRSPSNKQASAKIIDFSDAVTDDTSKIPNCNRIVRQPRRPRATIWQVFGGMYNFMLWFFLSFLFSAQFLGVIWNTVTSHQYLIYGRSPLNPLTPIPGQNDEPYSDRNIVCIAEGGSYIPKQLSAVLKDPTLSRVVDTSGSLIHGYRVCKRDEIGLDASVADHYVHVCTQISLTLPAIQNSCASMGYNVTNETLHVVDDTVSSTMSAIPRALPILVMPFWDNAIFAHYAIPGWDGIACVVRLLGKYEQPNEANLVIRGVSRSIRESKTAEWLQKPGGVWRNGWYEDGSGQRWYSDFQSTKVDNEYGMFARQFDGNANVELDCASPNSPEACRGIPATEWWGSKFSVTETVIWYNAVAISNGTRYGLFMYEAWQKRVVESKYSLETFISNVSLGWLLLRWFVSMYALFNTYRRGLAGWQHTGLGCLACSKSFNLLPIMLLPRLKYTMAAFWTAGCEFEGQQKSLSESWFAVYPGIAEFLLFYYSILNIVSKITYRRTSDVLFGPTLIFFCVMHRFRLELAQSGWFEFDGRISTILLSSSVESLQAFDFITSDVALKINGNIRSMFFVKLAILASNALPLIFSENMTSKGRKYRSCAPCDVEKSLAIRASNLGGLGRSHIYDLDENSLPESDTVQNGGNDEDQHSDVDKPVVVLPAGIWSEMSSSRYDSVAKGLRSAVNWFSPVVVPSSSRTRAGHALTNYEVNRLGYLVLGGQYLMSFEDWYILSSMAPLRVIDKLWNHRIIVFEVTQREDGFYVSRTAQLCRLDDARLLRIPFYDITVCSFR